jgi:hypothetical protein
MFQVQCMSFRWTIALTVCFGDRRFSVTDQEHRVEIEGQQTFRMPLRCGIQPMAAIRLNWPLGQQGLGDLDDRIRRQTQT